MHRVWMLTIHDTATICHYRLESKRTSSPYFSKAETQRLKVAGQTWTSEHLTLKEKLQMYTI